MNLRLQGQTELGGVWTSAFTSSVVSAKLPNFSAPVRERLSSSLAGQFGVDEISSEESSALGLGTWEEMPGQLQSLLLPPPDRSSDVTLRTLTSVPSKRELGFPAMFLASHSPKLRGAISWCNILTNREDILSNRDFVGQCF